MAYEYAKTILYAYPHLSALAEAVGQSAENKAMLSFRSGGDALTLAEEVAAALATKSRLLSLKEAADGAIGACGEEERFLLEYKYFRRKRELKKYGGAQFACSERSYFRHQAALLKKMAFLLSVRGWTEEAFLKAFCDFSPFLRALKWLAAGRERALVAHRRRRGIAFRHTSGSD